MHAKGKPASQYIALHVWNYTINNICMDGMYLKCQKHDIIISSLAKYIRAQIWVYDLVVDYIVFFLYYIVVSIIHCTVSNWITTPT